MPKAHVVSASITSVVIGGRWSAAAMLQILPDTANRRSKLHLRISATASHAAHRPNSPEMSFLGLPIGLPKDLIGQLEGTSSGRSRAAYRVRGGKLILPICNAFAHSL